MNTLRRLRILLLALFLAVPAAAQEPDLPAGTPIDSVQVSGLDLDRLSPGLRRDIDRLTGTPFDWETVGAIATRIEGEHPDRVTALRAIPTDTGGARVVILVARISDSRHLEDNINARYTIEKVDIDGGAAVTISQALRTDLQALVGTRLDREATDRLIERLRAELPGYDVERTISRGSRRGQIELVLRLRRAEAGRWLHFEPHRSKLLFHEAQRWSGFLDVPIGLRTGNVRVTPFFAVSNADDLVEEYSGWGLRVETRDVISQRVGLSIEFSRFTQDWRDETLAAIGAADAFALYRVRTTVTPMVSFAIDPRLRVSAGISATGLESRERPSRTDTANVYVAAADYSERWTLARGTHEVGASLVLRATADGLSSDLDYTRLLARAHYDYRWHHHRVLARASAGRITGVAPFFERFTLGDTTTLRGWDKYELAPAGADRAIDGSLEYRYRGLAFFLDSGALGDGAADTRVRTSAGLGVHGDNVFVTVGFPLNADAVDAMVMFGVRF